MRAKKSKNFLYLAIVLCILAVIFVATRDFSPKTERVEQPLENAFLK